MATFLLIIRSRINLEHIEAELDEFEQSYLPEAHYVLRREGRVATYVVVPDRPLDEFHKFLVAAAAKLLVEQISLVEVGSTFTVVEQGCSKYPADDACGEWRLHKDEATLSFEQLRFRTGLEGWLGRHAAASLDLEPPVVGLWLSFHHRQEENSRWLGNLKSALGKSARPHFRDEWSVLLTVSAAGEELHHLFHSKRYSAYVNSELVHTAFGFALGRNERHLAGKLESVRPPFHDGRASRYDQARAVPFVPKMVGGSSRTHSDLVQQAIAKLKAGRARP